MKRVRSIDHVVVLNLFTLIYGRDFKLCKESLIEQTCVKSLSLGGLVTTSKLRRIPLEDKKRLSAVENKTSCMPNL